MAICLLPIIACHAQQLAFEKTETDTAIQLFYRWEDLQNQTHELGFSLDRQLINSQFQKLKSYQPHIAQRYMMIAMQKAAREVDPREVRVSVRKVGQEVQYQIKAQSPELLEQWTRRLARVEDEAFRDYLAINYYAPYENYLGEEGVKVDHLRYAQESTLTLLPAANALYDKLMDNSQPRAYVNIMLGWLQSIPYDTLENRMVSRGTGFSAPAAVLIGNRGDCDSKTTLAVALLRSMLPNMGMVIIYLPGHALLGVQMSHRSQDALVRIEGLDYVLTEPTGPALLPVGEIAATSQAAIDGNMFTFEKIPPRMAP
ncbi:hypothetical protein [Bowmanella dokdonensis]|uniref:Transglutaminase-like domain-containing protein n=1 Tax=Bowmanella dokdonensis TaxID=751969 RepID=A0A939DQM2_9ALTE|nr:hypothetical protein [Bowmanella dokdonensis]MBN7826587.1 hypothetical protein [Bowmanella dokdonensis]